MPAAPAIRQWVRSMRAQGLSERTVEERELILGRLAAAAGVPLDEVTAEQIEDWFLAHDGWSAATRATYFSAVQSFMRWAVKRELRPDDPCLVLGKPKTPAGAPRPLSTESVRLLLAAAGRSNTRAYIVLGAFQGMRVSEIAQVRGEDVDRAGGWITIHGKGGRVDRVPMHPLTRELAAQRPVSGWWFPSPKGGHVTGNNVSNVVGKFMRRHGVQGSAHQLRHWYATQLVRDGVNIRIVQQLMRHASLQTTGRYAAVGDDLLVAAATGLAA